MLLVEFEEQPQDSVDGVNVLFGELVKVWLHIVQYPKGGVVPGLGDDLVEEPSGDEHKQNPAVYVGSNDWLSVNGADTDTTVVIGEVDIYLRVGIQPGAEHTNNILHITTSFDCIVSQRCVEYSRKMVVIMVIEVTAQTVITFAALLSAIGGIVALIVKLVHWVDNQKAQDGKITALEEKHEEDMKEIREESRLMIEGLLACLKAHQADGHNGPVTENIKSIETYLYDKAHESKE